MPDPTRGAAPRSRVREVLAWLRPPAVPTAEGPFSELDARRLGPIRRFFARHPVVMDVVIALLFAVPAMIEPLTIVIEGTRTLELQPSAWSLVLIAVGALVLLRRRREPVLTLAALVVLLVVSFLVTGFTGGFEMAIAFAIYAVAAHRGVWVAWIGLGSALVVLTVCASLLLADDPVEASGIDRIFVIAFTVGYQAIAGLVALVIGVSVRARRQHIDELIMRANAMARDRDQQAALAVADERTRIARELHDVVAHSLTVMVALADGARASAASDPVASTRALDALTEIGRSSLADMRRVLGVLREPDDDAPLEPEPDVSLDELVDRFRAAGLPVRLVRSGMHADLDVSVRRAVWRIVQESLTNVLRYAPESSQVVVSLVRTDRVDGIEGDWFQVRVTNRVDAASAPQATIGTGRGIIGMRERAAAHGGSVVAGPLADGWQVEATLRLDHTLEGTP
ncbi:MULTISPECIES: histidine kinase [unclassified Salinibacterium]|uniref:sensor histidine kinase n=1 Tax=unclassified Salinibacterium TaxID=2632331 RepID=UPI00141F5A6D|nr:MULTISPECIES: histidine kinase [unclassified Salinibacterium]